MKHKYGGQKGSSAILVAMMLSLLTMIPIAMSLSGKTYQDTTMALHVSQADNVARAGLEDSISWFRMHEPVNAAGFNPAVNANPALSATLDSTLGIVKEYPLTDATNMWARYEIKKPDVQDPHAIQEVTAKRVSGGASGSGQAWYLESVGYVLHKEKVGGKVVVSTVSTSRTSTEIRRIFINIPVAALIVNATSQVTFSGNGGPEIHGGSAAGLAYYNGASDPIHRRIFGNPKMQQIDIAGVYGSTVDPKVIFGISENEFKQMSDVCVNNIADLPAKYPQGAMVYIGGDAVFSNNLKGSGILYVKGNLKVSGAATNFNGLIYVGGSLTFDGGSDNNYSATLQGTVIVQGSVKIISSDEKSSCAIAYDADSLTMVQDELSHYREIKSNAYVYSGLK